MPANKYMEENGLVAILATMRSAGVAPEVNLREYVICMPMSSMNKAAHSGFEAQRICHQKFKQGYQLSYKNDLCPQFFFKKCMLISKSTCKNIRGTTCQ